MPIDARIPLQVNQFSLADVLKDAEAIKGAAQDRAYRAQVMRRQNEQDTRDAQFRGALADYLMGGNSRAPHTPPIVTPGDEPNAPPAPATAPDMSRATQAPYYGGQDALAPLPDSGPRTGSLSSMLTQPQGSPGIVAGDNPQADAFRRMVLADPKSALEARDAQFKHLDTQMDMIARLAGSAYDQPSYERALAQAHSMGLDTSQLPGQYSPELAKQVLNEALSAKERIAAERMNLKFQWDMQDDIADNERADENLESLEGYRTGQLANTRRGQDMTDRRVRGSVGYTRTGGSRGGGPPRTEGAVYADIANRWLRGETISPRETRFAQEYEARHTPRGRGRRGRMGGGGGVGGPMPAGGGAGPVRVNNIAEARALKPGTLFVGPDGVTRRR